MPTDDTKSLIEAVPMPLVLVGPDERIAAMNRAAAELFGADGTGRHYIIVLRQPTILDCIEQTMRGGQTGLTRYFTNDAIREVSYRVTTSPTSEGDHRSVLVAFEDITDMERAGQMRRDFVANVSHELKTPLTALLGFIETLRGAARDDGAARDRFLEIMEREAERMNRLVADLLSLSRVESTERVRPTEHVSIYDLVLSVISALRPMALAAEVNLQVEATDTELLVVPGDADQLTQVITNLIENAIKYGGSGGVVTVQLKHNEREVAFRGPGVRLDVVDHGDGFDPVHIPRLTERFYRVDTHRSREMGGTGLGLAIAKHIVNRHRGRFRIESVPGQGATFTVLLPASA